MPGDVVFLAEKGTHTPHLQNTLSAVHHGYFVLAHQLLSQFLIIQSVGGLAAPVLRRVVAVNRFPAQRVGDFLGVLSSPTQK